MLNEVASRQSVTFIFTADVYCTFSPPADPYVAAMEFLQANDLPDMYLDQVAEFIVQNAGEYQGPVSSGPTDPFTGIYIYTHTCSQVLWLIMTLHSGVFSFCAKFCYLVLQCSGYLL